MFSGVPKALSGRVWRLHIPSCPCQLLVVLGRRMETTLPGSLWQRVLGKAPETQLLFCCWVWGFCFLFLQDTLRMDVSFEVYLKLHSPPCEAAPAPSHPFTMQRLTATVWPGCEGSLNPVFLVAFHWLKDNGLSCWDLRELDVEMDLMEMIPMDPGL